MSEDQATQSGLLIINQLKKKDTKLCQIPNSIQL